MAVSKYRLCIIPDVRFRDETEMIKKLGGIIIKINRNTENNDNDKHISECIDNIKEDYIIDNNGTKFNLFYNIFNIINTVYREKREIIESRNNDWHPSFTGGIVKRINYDFNRT